ncbi:MAG: porin family protein [Marinilabiliaceae bacterium]|nr:porin family protein [Marinilabiliaceae bacterium]
MKQIIKYLGKNVRVTMGNFLLIACVVLFAGNFSAANAQEKGDKGIGVHVAFNTGDVPPPDLGFGAKFRTNFAAKWRLEAAFTYYAPKTLKEELLGVSSELKYGLWDLSANMHFLLRLGDAVNIYPLAGLSFLGQSVSGTATAFGVSVPMDDNVTDGFFNLGAGVDFKLSPKLTINAEPKLVIGEDAFLVISAGVLFNF